MKRKLVIGTGPSGYAVISALDDLEDVWIMDGNTSYKRENSKVEKHLGIKQKFESSHAYAKNKSIGIHDDSIYQTPISHSRGGFGEVWGTGFIPFSSEELKEYVPTEKISEVKSSMNRLLNSIPFVYIKSQLSSRFEDLNEWNVPHRRTNRLFHRVFDSICESRNSDNLDDGLVFGSPSLFLDSEICVKCGLCLSGCPYGVLFDPGESINRLISSGKLSAERVVSGIVTRLVPVDSGCIVHFLDNGVEKSEFYDSVMLATGPLSTAIILMNSNLVPDQLDVPDSQVFYGAYFTLKRIRAEDKRTEMSQMVCFPSSYSGLDFQLSFYAPSELTRYRVSQILFRRLADYIKFPKFISERIVPVIGFLPQDSSGKIRLERIGDVIKASRLKNSQSRINARRSLMKAAKPLKSFGFFSASFLTRVPDPGAGFHLGASLPLGGKFLDEMGCLRNSPQIQVLDASILQKIPAGAHTFLSMALIMSIVKGRQ